VYIPTSDPKSRPATRCQITISSCHGASIRSQSHNPSQHKCAALRVLPTGSIPLGVTVGLTPIIPIPGPIPLRAQALRAARDLQANVAAEHRAIHDFADAWYAIVTPHQDLRGELAAWPYSTSMLRLIQYLGASPCGMSRGPSTGAVAPGLWEGLLPSCKRAALLRPVTNSLIENEPFLMPSRAYSGVRKI